MLREQNLDHGCFGETELTALLEVGGWEAILPSALKDRQLLAVANQMRDLVLDQHAELQVALERRARDDTAAHRVTEPKRWAPATISTSKWKPCHDVLELLSARIDQEIVDRVLQRRNERSDVNADSGDQRN
ncbi:hypothetical protein [Acidovorax sp. JHL-3]|uniref:hypothetical protein n=1 Tax=Acidovorax sp. JHL-3 TaxID=1276755 RepID=UPI0012DDC539|nr:hypothetical protein [Acidovorax sp. JHL-3]